MEPNTSPRRILASYTDDTIRIYQAYNRYIAEEAVRLGTFGSHFGMHRMTWIKPSFLWMMYRCGWAEKDSNQECVLAIDLSRKGFDTILQNAVLSSFHEDVYGTLKHWEERRNTAQVICQWDPDRDAFGSPLPRRAIQLGLRGDMVQCYVHDWICGVTDITDQVRSLKLQRDAGEMLQFPEEKEYPVSEEIRKILGMQQRGA